MPEPMPDAELGRLPAGAGCTQSTKGSPWGDSIPGYPWQWHVIVMGTGMCSSLLHNFPFNNGGVALKIAASSFFVLDLIIFVALCAWTAVRCYLFKQERVGIFIDPSKSLSMGLFVNGLAALLNAGLAANEDWQIGGNSLLYTLWGLWTFNYVLSCIVTFGAVYMMMGQKPGNMGSIGPVWVVPVITMVTVSASGSLYTRSLIPHSHVLSMVTLTLTSTMLLIGLSLTMAVLTALLIRLYIYGPIDSQAVLTTFTTLTPIGQAGYSMLLNGRDLADLLPDQLQGSIPASPLIGNILFSICFCGGYALWCLGITWIAISSFSVIRQQDMSAFRPFRLSHWSVVVPNGAFALLSVELAVTLNSTFFRIFGVVWSCITISLWTILFLCTIPALIHGTMFSSVDDSEDRNALVGRFQLGDAHKENASSVSQGGLGVHDRLGTESMTDTLYPGYGSVS